MSATVDQSVLNGSSPTKAKNIQIRRVQLNDSSQMPSDLSSTPGGTLFSTTPGGTRIVYDRSFLLECRNSPLAKSPPVGLPPIPGVTCVAISPGQTKNGVSPHQHHHYHAGGSHIGHVPTYAQNATAVPSAVQKPAGAGDEQMFEIDM